MSIRNDLYELRQQQKQHRATKDAESLMEKNGKICINRSLIEELVNGRPGHSVLCSSLQADWEQCDCGFEQLVQKFKDVL